MDPYVLTLTNDGGARGLLPHGVCMGHDWLFEVLADMKTYATRHGFSALATKIDEVEAVARAEIAGSDPPGKSVPNKPARRN